jgi:hypothetical protein
MKSPVRNRWMAGGIAFLWFWILPMAVFSEKASIRDVQIAGTNGEWKVSFNVENCFTEKMEEAIKTGVPTTFAFYLQLYQVRTWWKDRKVASLNLQHTIQYSPLRGEYQVSLEEKGTVRITQNFEEAKRWMSRVEGAEIRSSSDFKPDILSYLRIKAELDPVKLPLHLEYLFFFLSLWDFQTDWHIETLSP